MSASTRTPEGEPNRCPVCGLAVRLEPSRPSNDAPCPHCGTLLWFLGEDAAIRENIGAPGSDLPGVLTAWDYGNEKIRRGDIAIGLAVLRNVITHKPQDVVQRRVLREIERRLCPKPPGQSEATVLLDVWAEIRRAQHKRSGTLVDWDAIDIAAERGLAVAPWDADLHVELAHACRARGYRETARFAYECALEIAPDRDDIRQFLAELAS